MFWNIFSSYTLVIILGFFFFWFLNFDFIFSTDMRSKRYLCLLWDMAPFLAHMQAWCFLLQGITKVSRGVVHVCRKWIFRKVRKNVTKVHVFIFLVLDIHSLFIVNRNNTHIPSTKSKSIITSQPETRFFQHEIYSWFS